MDTTLLIGLALFLVLFLIIRAPKQVGRFLGNGVVRITIGVLFLFLFNMFGGSFGLHIPINFFSVTISSLLGLLGVFSLAAIHLFILA